MRHPFNRPALLGAALAAASVLVCPTPTALAESVDLLCQHTISMHFTPPLTTLGQHFTFTITSSLGSCISPTGRASDVQTGEFINGTGEGVTSVACPLFNASGTGVWVFRDAAGNDTDATGDFPFEVNLTNTSRLGGAGTLQNGRLKDDHGTTYPVPLFTGSCPAGGVSELNTTGIATFTSAP